MLRDDLSAYPRTVRQLIVHGLGRDVPPVIITNGTALAAKAIIERYARRMTIEQRLAEAIRALHLDALSSAVVLNVDLDVVHRPCRRRLCRAGPSPARLPRRHPRPAATPLPRHRRRHLQPRRPHRRRLNRRAYSPVLRAADLPPTAVPWWGGRTLHYEFA